MAVQKTLESNTCAEAFEVLSLGGDFPILSYASILKEVLDLAMRIDQNMHNPATNYLTVF